MFRAAILIPALALASLLFPPSFASAQYYPYSTPQHATPVFVYYNSPPFGNYSYPVWFSYYWNLGYFRPYLGYPITPVAYSYGHGSLTATESASQRAFVKVYLPTTDAEVWLNGGRGQLKGSERLFRSPPIEPGRDYSYSIVVRWRQDGRAMEEIREVNIRAGETSAVDFRVPEGELLIVPPKRK